MESTGPHAPSDEFLQQTGATQLASDGDTGQGVTVAVLDTGIDRLPDFAGRLIGGVDLTGENDPFQDDYGHGTFVAGLIAGDGTSSGGQYQGEAPGADLVSIKVAGADGTTDLVRLILGLQWAIQNRLAYNIGVLNMSLGFRPFESTAINPLDLAVEAAWNSGIAVVASAGNAGPSNGTILSPGDDPLVITVGALDDLAQPVTGNDEMTNFSSAGPTPIDGWVKPDLVTSGRSVVSLAAPGSTIDDENPSARIGSGNFVGSGTSFSSAIASGAAALVLADNPGLTPDQLKARLLGTTDPGSGRQSLRGRARGPGRLRRGQRRSHEPPAVRVRPAAGAARHDGLAVPGGQSGRHLELRISGRVPRGRRRQGRARWPGSAWNGAVPGTALPGPAGPGTTAAGTARPGTAAAWAGSAWDGSAWAGLGLERRRLGQRRLERVGMELAAIAA